MSRIRMPLVPLALLCCASIAGAQRTGGSPASPGRLDSHVGTNATSGGSWNGTPSKWGGSPVRSQAESRVRAAYVIPSSVYTPVAAAAPAPVEVTYVVDTVFVAPPASPAGMRVVRPSRPQPELTVMDVYRQQRFKRP